MSLPLPRGPLGLTVKVFRDDPAWDRHPRWFLMPNRLLDDLYICTYELRPDPENPEIAANPVRDLAWIERQHPGCVFVY